MQTKDIEKAFTIGWVSFYVQQIREPPKGGTGAEWVRRKRLGREP